MDRLANTVRPYAWGSTTAIPELLGTPVTGEPQAELWLGAHPGAPSRVDRGDGPRSLSDVVAADPHGELGAASVREFGPTLPFLLKLLAAAAPLSLQVHPDRAGAAAGFTAEEALGIPLDAPHRNYKDTNHKPELLCALTPFDGLCGFRDPAATADLLAALDVDSLKPYVDLLHAHPETDALREVLTAVLTADRAAMAETAVAAGAAAERLPGRRARTGRLRRLRVRRPALPRRPGRRRGHAPQPRTAPARRGALPRRRGAARLPRRTRRRDHGQLRQRAALRADTQAHRRPRTAARRPLRAERPGGAAPGGGAGRRGGLRHARRRVPPLPVRTARRRPAAPAGRARPADLLCTGGTALLRGDDGSELSLAQGESAFVRAGEHAVLDGAGTLFRATVAV
ncbi:hypothetical protein GCM10020221_25530 [Streptomyces thioluteus]|uniref:mannose-6-phosphate isomerase n=1 Tax=Streptomyces thioluteus TaxID=66431 RepID=A0ABN3WUL7_STRTU